MTNDEIIDAFHKRFVNPDEAAFGLDREGVDGYFWQTEPVETRDGVLEIDDSLDEARQDAIVAELEDTYHHWARRSEVDHITD